MNPSRSKSTDYRPARVTVAVLVHIPHLTGYYEGRLRVLEACLESLIRNTQTAHDLLLFDNASCEPVQEYLAQVRLKGHAQLLIRSERNLGKIGALKLLFPAAPGELIAYSDDDFYFEPGWLQSQLRLLDTYPNVGMVSGYVIPSLFAQERISANIAFAEQTDVSLQVGKFIEPAWIEEWALSTGRAPEAAVAEAQPLQEYVLEYRGVAAFAAANHDQFLAPKAVMLEALPDVWGGQLMGEMLALDERVNRLGYLRLATRSRTTRHLGNQLPQDIATRLGLSRESSAPNRRLVDSRSLRARVLRWPPIRSLLLGLYSRLFSWINPD